MFPELGLDNKEFILKIHRELLKGTPVTRKSYYQMTTPYKEKADAVLEKMGELDQQGNIVAFAGLSLTPTQHTFIVNGKMFYTWCVVDAILFSEWLDVSSHIFSNDPIDNTPIELKIEKDHLLWTNPYPLFISWVDSMDTCNIRGSLCDHVSFFAGETTARRWQENNPVGKILSIDDFFESAKSGLSCC